MLVSFALKNSIQNQNIYIHENPFFIKIHFISLQCSYFVYMLTLHSFPFCNCLHLWAFSSDQTRMFSNSSCGILWINLKGSSSMASEMFPNRRKLGSNLLPQKEKEKKNCQTIYWLAFLSFREYTSKIRSFDSWPRPDMLQPWRRYGRNIGPGSEMHVHILQMTVEWPELVIGKTGRRPCLF